MEFQLTKIPFIRIPINRNPLYCPSIPYPYSIPYGRSLTLEAPGDRVKKDDDDDADSAVEDTKKNVSTLNR